MPSSPYSTVVSLSGVGLSSTNPDGLTDNLSPSLLSITTTPYTVTRTANMGRLNFLNKVSGIALTLPLATGSGDTYEFVIGATITSVGTTFTAAGADKYQGNAWALGGAAVVTGYIANAGTSTVVTLNGTTQGGIVGGRVIFRDVAAARWDVIAMGGATGTVATPFN